MNTNMIYNRINMKTEHALLKSFLNYIDQLLSTEHQQRPSMMVYQPIPVHSQSIKRKRNHHKQRYL